MKKTLLLVAVLATCGLPSLAQPRILLGVESGLRTEYRRLDDPLAALDNRASIGPALTGTLSVELKPWLWLETGLGVVRYSESLSFPSMTGWTSNSAMGSLQVPLRAGFPLELRPGRLYLTPWAGLRGGVNLSHYPLGEADAVTGSGSGGWDGFAYHSRTQDNFHRHFGMGELGLSLEREGAAGWRWMVKASYSQGFQRLAVQTLDYTLADGRSGQAVFESWGSHLQLTAGVRYVLSRHWQDRGALEAQRQARRAAIAEAQGRRLHLYPSVGLASDRYRASAGFQGSWPGYGSRGGDPSVVLLLGWSLGQRWELQAGIAGRTYSNRYYHEDPALGLTGGAFSSGGNGLLILPLRLRHRFDMASLPLSVVPYLGVALLLDRAGEGRYDSRLVQMGVPGTTDFDSLGRWDAYRQNLPAVVATVGASLEYHFSPRASLFIDMSRQQGFQTLNRLEYTPFRQPASEGLIEYRGSGWNGAVGLRIPIF